MRIKTILNQDFENLPRRQEEEKNPEPKMASKKPVVVFASIFGAVLILLLATAIFMGFNQKGGLPTKTGQTTPTPTPEFKEEITSPSPYATDSAILKNEQEIKSLDEKIQQTDLKETSLNPPILDWNIQFEEE